MEIRALEREDLSPAIERQIKELFNELIPNSYEIDLLQMLSSKNSVTMIVCIDNDEVIGMASVGTYYAVSGHKAWVEDVVVAGKHRGRGIGRHLMEKIVERCESKEIDEILLFTEDHRAPAINLYVSLGFKLKDSRIYTYKSRSRT